MDVERRTPVPSSQPDDSGIGRYQLVGGPPVEL
jgi:hypothetical protein